MTVSDTQFRLDNLPAPLVPILAALLGSMMPVAFAPLSIWPLGILLPALLIALTHNERNWRRVFVIGWLFGLGYFGYGMGLEDMLGGNVGKVMGAVGVLVGASTLYNRFM